MKKNKKAISLIEISIAAFLAFIILGSILNVFSSGLKGSTKNLTHQDNMETANILMSQIELDLLKATEIKKPGWNQEDNNAQWVMNSSTSLGDISFTYDFVPNSLKGVHRLVKGNNIEESHYYAKDHLVNLNFTHLVINSKNPSNNNDNTENDNNNNNDNSENNNNNPLIEKHAMWVEIEIGSSKGDVASYTLKRLITLKSRL